MNRFVGLLAPEQLRPVYYLNVKTKNTYSVPVDTDFVTRIVLENPSHQGVYKGSIDLAVPIGTPVKAAREGVVTRVRDDSKKYGETSDFGQLVNYISILHDNDEISEYLHLAKSSAKVKPGDKVQNGQIIAETGLSGWMFAPHLHFMVFKQTDSHEDFQCLEVRFDTELQLAEAS